MIPLFPIYGYDREEEAELDYEYMKQLYPSETRLIRDLIEDTCDRLEYEGSILFDEYPDKLQIALLADRIYRQVAPPVRTTDTDEDHADLIGSASATVSRKRRDPDWLRNLIEIMLCTEMCQRRRRFRSRRRYL